MKTTINPINYDLINDKVEILIGGKRNKWITGEQYRILRSFCGNWTSGLRHVQRYDYNTYQTTMYYNDANVVTHVCYSGLGESSLIKSIIA